MTNGERTLNGGLIGMLLTGMLIFIGWLVDGCHDMEETRIRTEVIERACGQCEFSKQVYFNADRTEAIVPYCGTYVCSRRGWE